MTVIEAEALVHWLGGDGGSVCGGWRARPIRRRCRAINRAVLARPGFRRRRGSVAARRDGAVLARDPRPYRPADRGAALVGCRHGTIFPPLPEGRPADRDARATLPEEPWDASTWVELAGRDAGQPDRVGTLRLILTGEEQGPTSRRCCR